jgi:hypothetical protein
MMKTNYLFIGMAALMIAACSNNENEPQVDDGRIAVSFAGEITLPRATTDTWEANDGIGIYMLEHGMKTVTDGATNRKYVTTAGDGKFTPAGTEQTIYFPLNADEKVDFIAYYPQTDLTDDIYKVDVSDQKAPADIDLLRSDNATGKDKSTNTVDLKFFHRLSRVEVELTAGEGVSDTELAGIGHHARSTAREGGLQRVAEHADCRTRPNLSYAEHSRRWQDRLRHHPAARGCKRKEFETNPDGRHCIDMAGGSRAYLRAR